MSQSTRQEWGVALYLAFLLLLCLGALYAAWCHVSLLMLLGGVCPPDEVKTAVYVLAGGGLGSTAYCVRAFYSYTMAGDFRYETHKWWYMFRPLTGVVLALAVYALARGGVVAFGGGQPVAAPSQNYAYLGLAFLSGFFVEHVIERLKEVSKAAFAFKKPKMARPPRGGNRTASRG